MIEKEENICAVLARSHIRNTQPRRIILAALGTVARPLSPAEIEVQLGCTVDLVTIYRTLALFEKNHLVHKHPSTSGYLLCTIPERFGHHGFLTCTSCKTTEEFHDPRFCKLEEAIAHRAKFSAMEHVSEILGLCSHCRL